MATVSSIAQTVLEDPDSARIVPLWSFCSKYIYVEEQKAVRSPGAEGSLRLGRKGGGRKPAWGDRDWDEPMLCLFLLAAVAQIPLRITIVTDTM